MSKNVLKNQRRTLEIGANVASAVASRNLKIALSTLSDVKTFYDTGKGLYLEKTALLWKNFISIEWLLLSKFVAFCYFGPSCETAREIRRRLLNCESTLASRMNEAADFIISNNNNRKMITRFKDKNHQSKNFMHILNSWPQD